MRIRYSFFSLLRDMRFSRVVAGLTIAAILLPVYQPLSAASGPPSGSDAGPHGLGTAPGQALSQSIRKAKAVLENADRALTRGQTVSAEMQELAALRKLIGSLDAEVRAEFEGVGNWLAEKQLPQKIVARHENAVAFYREQVQTLLDDLALLEVEGMEEERAAIVHRVYQRLSAQKHEASQHPFNPAELPHEAQRPRSDNLPRMRRDDFLGAGLVDTPLVQFAALEGYRFDTLPGADDPAYLGESVEVKLNAALRAKAEELGHDPVAIYHWVRNHVEWLPTWGAVQDAELTLSARRGNAMDIASLLISLLRASGIPARYVHGTIEVPEEAFRNWTGGFKHIEEAMNYAASGGIPITGMITGGRISHVRLEHIWVEAAVDFLPSRGAVMREADTWLPLDASYKQYEFLPGLDMIKVAEIDGQTVLRDLLNTGTLNEGYGSLQGLEPAILIEAHSQVHDRVAAHVEGLEAPLVGDILGAKKIVRADTPVLPAGLPYRSALIGLRYDALPRSLQTRIVFDMASSVPGQPGGKASFAWAELNNQQVTLSFRPATMDDQAILESLFPEENEPLDLADLPSRIPAYLINVVPELKIKGKVALSAAPLSLGAPLRFSFSVVDPTHGERHYPKTVSAGSYLAFGIVGSGVPSVRVEESASRLLAIAERLVPEEIEYVRSWTREDLLGGLFHAALLSYFGQYQSIGQLMAQTQGYHFQLNPSAGTFGYVPTVSYLFGLPHSLLPGGLWMDLDRVALTSSTDGGTRESWATLNLSLGGLASALEHGVPEQVFGGRSLQGKGVSTASAMAKAISKGQDIYHLTATNRQEILPLIHQNEATIREIDSALAIGRSVITHSEPLTLSGWQGAGYLIFDPDTGAGAWRIAGGANGGFFGELEQAFASPMFHLSSAQTASYLLTRTLPSFGDYRTAIKDAGNVLLGVGAFMTVVEVRNETESNWKAFAAGGADLGITFMGGVSAKSIFAIAAGANPVVAAVVVSVSLGFIVSSARSQIVDYIKDARIASRSSVA